MANSIQVTVQLNNDHKKEVIATVQPGGTLPLDIFAYINNGTSQLTEYFGVVDLGEYQRLQTFTGTPIQTFGNKYVKYIQAKIILDVNDDETVVINHIVETVKSLEYAFTHSSSTTTIIEINN